MRKEDLIIERSVEIAHAIRNITEDLSKENEIPFVPGWQDKANDLMPLVENIVDLYKHPRKNKEVLYFLNMLANNYYIK